jgi:hypothetical protein
VLLLELVLVMLCGISGLPSLLLLLKRWCILLLRPIRAVCQAAAGVHGIWPRVQWVAEVEHRDVQVLARITKHLVQANAPGRRQQKPSDMSSAG